MTARNIKNSSIVGSGIWINPPPADEKCQCCGRHISEQVPFDKTGDLFFDDFDEEFLSKNFRRMGVYDVEAEYALSKVSNFMEKAGQADGDLLEWSIKIYGEELGKKYFYSNAAYEVITSSWECSECLSLNQNEYIERFYKRAV